MINSNIKKLVVLYTVTFLGLLLGVWLSPQMPITSFLPVKGESIALKDALLSLAFTTGVLTSIFSLIGSHYLRLNYVYTMIAIMFYGLLFNSLDLVRFGELTIDNLVWFGVFLLGMILTLTLKKVTSIVISKMGR